MSGGVLGICGVSDGREGVSGGAAGPQGGGSESSFIEDLTSISTNNKHVHSSLFNKK